MWSRCGLSNAADYSLVALTDAPDPVSAGGDLTYRIVVSNAGPATASSVAVVSQTLATDAAAGTLLLMGGQAPRGCGLAGPVYACLIGDLAVGATAEAVIVVRPLGAPRTLSASFNITSPTDSSDPNSANNAATVSTTVTGAPAPPPPPPPPPTPANCHPSYPTVCIPPPPPDLDCGQITFRNFQVIYTVPGADPHNFDGDRDGVGCEQ